MLVEPKYNVQGMGWDCENSAIFHTRVAMPEMTTDEGFARSVNMQTVAESREPEIICISKLEGVTKVSVYSSESKYELAVKKGGAFDWDEIAPSIISLLEDRHNRITKDREI